MVQNQLAAIQAVVEAGQHRVTVHVAKDYLTQAGRPTITEAETGVCAPEATIIELNPNDPRGPSVLIYTEVNGRPLHVVCSEPPDCALISYYWPDTMPQKWTPDFRRRI